MCRRGRVGAGGRKYRRVWYDRWAGVTALHSAAQHSAAQHTRRCPAQDRAGQHSLSSMPQQAHDFDQSRGPQHSAAQHDTASLAGNHELSTAQQETASTAERHYTYSRWLRAVHKQAQLCGSRLCISQVLLLLLLLLFIQAAAGLHALHGAPHILLGLEQSGQLFLGNLQHNSFKRSLHQTTEPS